jgi:hypothetical protein
VGSVDGERSAQPEPSVLRAVARKLPRDLRRFLIGDRRAHDNDDKAELTVAAIVDDIQDGA